MWIVERSKLAAERGLVWRKEDHEALLRHLAEIDRLAQAMAKLAVREVRRKRVPERKAAGCEVGR